MKNMVVQATSAVTASLRTESVLSEEAKDTSTTLSWKSKIWVFRSTVSSRRKVGLPRPFVVLLNQRPPKRRRLRQFRTHVWDLNINLLTSLFYSCLSMWILIYEPSTSHKATSKARNDHEYLPSVFTCASVWGVWLTGKYATKPALSSRSVCAQI